MKYLIEKNEMGFPFIIRFYYDGVCNIGDIEVFRTGKIYFNDFPINSGMSIKTIQKVLKIAKKELIKQKIRNWWGSDK